MILYLAEATKTALVGTADSTRGGAVVASPGGGGSPPPHMVVITLASAEAMNTAPVGTSLLVR